MFRNTVRRNLIYGVIIQYPLYKDFIKSIVSNLLENPSEASNNTLSIHVIFISSLRVITYLLHLSVPS